MHYINWQIEKALSKNVAKDNHTNMADNHILYNMRFYDRFILYHNWKVK